MHYETGKKTATPNSSTSNFLSAYAIMLIFDDVFVDSFLLEFLHKTSFFHQQAAYCYRYHGETPNAGEN